MTWKSNQKRSCLKCGRNYIYEESTVNMANGNFGQCPYCDSPQTMKTELTVEKDTDVKFNKWLMQTAR